MFFSKENLNEIIADENRCEHFFLYFEEKTNSYYTVKEMYELVEDEETIIFDVVPYEFNENGEEEFIKGFLDNAPDWYDFEKDVETPSPWCTPWEWNESEKELWFSDKKHPYDMGKSYVEHMSETMKAFFTEDE